MTLPTRSGWSVADVPLDGGRPPRRRSLRGRRTRTRTGWPSPCKPLSTGVGEVVAPRPWIYLGATLEHEPAWRIQLCGRVAIERAGERLEGGLPGRQGRRCFVYLAAHRARPVPRDELIEAVWGAPAPAADARPERADLEAAAGAGHRRPAGPRRGAARVARRHVDRPRGRARGDPPRRVGGGHAGLGASVERRPGRRCTRPAAGCCPATRASGSTSSAASSTACICARWRPTARRPSASAAPSSPPPSARAASSPTAPPTARAATGCSCARSSRAGTRPRRWPPTRALRVLLRDELGIGPSAPTKELHLAILGG